MRFSQGKAKEIEKEKGEATDRRPSVWTSTELTCPAILHFLAYESFECSIGFFILSHFSTTRDGVQ
jgi:hypothetical protein